MGRRGLREQIFKLLFMSEFHPKEELEEQVNLYLEESESLQEADAEYVRKKYASVREKTEEIDALLNDIAKGWKTSRMGKADLNILRLAIYEIRYDPDVPEKVAANEAVEIAKKYEDPDVVRFINGILGSFVRSEAAEAPPVQSPPSDAPDREAPDQ